MKNFRLANIIDFIFTNILIFLIVFVWLKFFNKNILYSFILSLFFLVIFNLLKVFFKGKKTTKLKLNKNLEKDIELYMYSLISNTNEENLLFFKNILKKFNPTTENNIIFYKKNEIKYALCPLFESANLNIEKALKNISCCKTKNIKNILILCSICQKKDKILLEQISEMNIKIYQKKEIYLNLFKPSNTYPNIKFNFKESKKIKIYELLEISFNKSKAKGYFLSGIFIFFCSFIMKYNIYYVLMSSILFTFALISYIKKDKSIKKETLLD